MLTSVKHCVVLPVAHYVRCVCVCVCGRGEYVCEVYGCMGGGVVSASAITATSVSYLKMRSTSPGSEPLTGLPSSLSLRRGYEACSPRCPP